MKKSQFLRPLPLVSAFLLAGSLCSSLFAQSEATLEQRIKKIMDRPEFAHSRFGIKFYSMDTGNVVYELNSQQLFVPGSTTKLLTEGTALELLGGDYRFHTKIYRTGPIKKDGTLDGDLILLASGDYDLSNRIQSDDTLAFEDEDHSYGGPDSKGLAGDTLVVMHEFAKQIADRGIKRVKGNLLVDASLFPEGERELGTGIVISPIVVNDNVIDVIATPGATEGSPVVLAISPQDRVCLHHKPSNDRQSWIKSQPRLYGRKNQPRWHAQRHAYGKSGDRSATTDGVLPGPGAQPICSDGIERSTEGKRRIFARSLLWGTRPISNC